MSCAKQVGRVGALAAALGLSIVVAAAPAICYADPAVSGSGGSSSQSPDPSSSSPKSSPSDSSGASTDAADSAADKAGDRPGLVDTPPTTRGTSDDTVDSTVGDEDAVDVSVSPDADGASHVRGPGKRPTAKSDDDVSAKSRKSPTATSFAPAAANNAVLSVNTPTADADVPASDRRQAASPQLLSTPLTRTLLDLTAAPAASARTTLTQAVTSGAGPRALATADPIGVIPVIKLQVVRFLDAAAGWLPSQPGNPAIDFLQGALLLVRRWISPVSAVGVSPNVGVNFSTLLANPAPSYAESVKAIKDQGITSIRMYDITPAALSEIQTQIPDARVSVAIPNSQVAELANNPAYAASVVESLKPYNSIVKSIAVGNEVDAAFPNDLQTVQRAVKNMQDAAHAANLPVDVTTSFTTGIVVDTYPPSASRLNPNFNGLPELLRQVDRAEVNIYPLFALVDNPRDISLDYALGNPTSSPVNDNGVIYHSLFWAQYDGVQWAFNRAGITTPINVGETGWATNSTNGYANSTVENARIYNQNLVTSMLTTGSPKFGTKDIPFYLFEFSDENQKSGGVFEKYWGWYAVNGDGTLRQKYPLNLTVPATQLT